MKNSYQEETRDLFSKLHEIIEEYYNKTGLKINNINYNTQLAFSMVTKDVFPQDGLINITAIKGVWNIEVDWAAQQDYVLGYYGAKLVSEHILKF